MPRSRQAPIPGKYLKHGVDPGGLGRNLHEMQELVKDHRRIKRLAQPAIGLPSWDDIIAAAKKKREEQAVKQVRAGITFTLLPSSIQKIADMARISSLSRGQVIEALLDQVDLRAFQSDDAGASISLGDDLLDFDDPKDPHNKRRGQAAGKPTMAQLQALWDAKEAGLEKEQRDLDTRFKRATITGQRKRRRDLGGDEGIADHEDLETETEESE
jgi:hypothetical protein